MAKDLVYLCIGAEQVLADRAVAKILEPLKEKGATNTQFDAPALEVGQLVMRLRHLCFLVRELSLFEIYKI